MNYASDDLVYFGVVSCKIHMQYVIEQLFCIMDFGFKLHYLSLNYIITLLRALALLLIGANIYKHTG